MADTDTDGGGGGSSSNCSGGSGGWNCTCTPVADCCTTICNNYGATATCNGRPACDPPPPVDDCDIALGAGKTEDMDGQVCGIAGGNRYMVEGQPDLHDTFACLAEVGTMGDGTERPMESMVEAITTQNQAGQCNEAFVRDDAILVVTVITDEADNGKSVGNPDSWRAEVLDVKNNDEEAVVVLALVGDTDLPTGVCQPLMNNDGADGAPRIRQFADSFTFGQWGSICEPNFAPFFEQAVSVIDSACDIFIPPG